MLYRKLGSSDIDISVVGFGAWAIGGWMWGGTDEDQAVAAIHAALDNGVNLIDTAPMYGYGRSEEIVGRALRGGRRHRAVLASKCGLIWDREEGEFHFHADQDGVTPGPSQKRVFKCLRPKSIRAELEQSLRRLRTDCVDLYQTHWQDSTTPIEDTMAELLKLRDEGKIRAIGVSNAGVEHLERYGQIHSAQERFNMLDRKIEQNGVLEFCREHQIAMLAYSPLANGLLTGKLRPDRQFGPGDLRRRNPRFKPENIGRVNEILQRLAPLAAQHGATIGQMVTAWTFSQPGLTSVLCGARNAQQAAENAFAGTLALEADVIQALDRAAEELAGD